MNKYKPVFIYCARFEDGLHELLEVTVPATAHVEAQPNNRTNAALMKISMAGLPCISRRTYLFSCLGSASIVAASIHLSADCRYMSTFSTDHCTQPCLLAPIAIWPCNISQYGHPTSSCNFTYHALIAQDWPNKKSWHSTCVESPILWSLSAWCFIFLASSLSRCTALDVPVCKHHTQAQLCHRHRYPARPHAGAPLHVPSISALWRPWSHLWQPLQHPS